MGVPWKFKKYTDETLMAMYGKIMWAGDGRSRTDPSKQYGTGGLAQKKKYMLSLTFNAPKEAFNNKD